MSGPYGYPFAAQLPFGHHHGLLCLWGLHIGALLLDDEPGCITTAI